MIQLLFCLALFLPLGSFASDSLLVRVTGENQWVLNAQVRADFEKFLDRERVDLLDKIPVLNFPEKFQPTDDIINSWAVATSPTFKNREVSCGFLKKVSLNLRDSEKEELNKLTKTTRYAQSLGMTVNAGHGLKYHNTRPVARIPGMNELNIGHSIMSRAIFVGLEQAVREMLKIIKGS